jgi:hypothetical protein
MRTSLFVLGTALLAACGSFPSDVEENSAATSSLTQTDRSASDIALQGDRLITRIVSRDGSYRSTLRRYLPDGTLDVHFGQAGLCDLGLHSVDANMAVGTAGAVFVFGRPVSPTPTVDKVLVRVDQDCTSITEVHRWDDATTPKASSVQPNRLYVVPGTPDSAILMTTHGYDWPVSVRQHVDTLGAVVEVTRDGELVKNDRTLCRRALQTWPFCPKFGWLNVGNFTLADPPVVSFRPSETLPTPDRSAVFVRIRQTIYRYQASGLLDITFGTGGSVVLPGPLECHEVRCMGFDVVGRLVAISGDHGFTRVLRYDDSTFGFVELAQARGAMKAFAWSPTRLAWCGERHVTDPDGTRRWQPFIDSLDLTAP